MEEDGSRFLGIFWCYIDILSIFVNVSGALRYPINHVRTGSACRYKSKERALSKNVPGRMGDGALGTAAKDASK